MNSEMWDKILTIELIMYMQKVSGDTESKDTVSRFFDVIKQRMVDHKVLIVMAMNWKTYEQEKQVRLAVHHAGMYHASRFIMMMEYMSHKILKGDFK